MFLQVSQKNLEEGCSMAAMLWTLFLCADVSATPLNDFQLFQNEDLLDDFIFPSSSVQDLRAMCGVSIFFSERIPITLTQRKLEHENAIKSIIKELQRRGREPLVNSTSPDQLMNQFVHGFDGRLQFLMVKVVLPDEDAEDGGVCHLGINETERLWLKSELLKLRKLLNDYVANYDPVGASMARLMDNTTKLYEFLKMQRQSERFIAELEAACEKTKNIDVDSHDFYEFALISVWSSTLNLKFLMQSIGCKVGCTQIINPYKMSIDIASYWKACNDSFTVWKEIIDSPPCLMNNDTDADEFVLMLESMQYILLKDNDLLIQSLLEFLIKIKDYVVTHNLLVAKAQVWSFRSW